MYGLELVAEKKDSVLVCIASVPISKSIASTSTQAAEQVLLVRPRQAGGAQGAAAQGASEPELSLQYLRPPQTYIDAAYPLVRREGRGVGNGVCGGLFELACLL